MQQNQPGWTSVGKMVGFNVGPKAVTELPDGRLFCCWLNVKNATTYRPGFFGSFTLADKTSTTYHKSTRQMFQIPELLPITDAPGNERLQHAVWWDRERHAVLTALLTDDKVMIFELSGENALPISTNLRVSGTNDQFVWHGSQQRMLHIVGSPYFDKPRTAPTSRRVSGWEDPQIAIFDQDRWRPFDAPMPQQQRNDLEFAAWDPVGKRVLVRDDRTWFAVAEGQPAEPLAPRDDHQLDPTQWSATTTQAGHLLAVGRSEAGCVSFELGPQGWTVRTPELAGKPQRMFGVDPTNSPTFVGYRTSPREPGSLVVTENDGEYITAGPIDSIMANCVADDGRALAWQNAADTQSTHIVELDRAASAWNSVLGFTELCLGVFLYEGDPALVTQVGAIHRFDRTRNQWTLLAPPPMEFIARQGAGLSWSDHLQELVIYGGRKINWKRENGERFLNDLHLWSPTGGWRQSNGSGQPHLLSPAVGWDPIRHVAVLVGGKKDKRATVAGIGDKMVHEVGFEATQSFELEATDVNKYSSGGFLSAEIGWEPISEQLVFTSSDRAYIYKGAGRFELAFRYLFTLAAFDRAKQTILGNNYYGTFERSIADELRDAQTAS